MHLRRADGADPKMGKDCDEAHHSAAGHRRDCGGSLIVDARRGSSLTAVLGARLSTTLEHLTDAPVRTAAPYVGYFNLLKGTLGSGILGMPFAFSLAGWGLGTAMLLLVAVGSAYGLFLLSACAHKIGGSSTSFNELAGRTYPLARSLVDMLILVNCFGAAVSYLIVIGQNLGELSVAVFGIPADSFCSSEAFWKIVVFWGVIAPLGSLKRLSMLKFTSVIGVVCVFYITAMTAVYALAPGVDPCPDVIGEKYCGGTVTAFSSDANNILAALPVFAFAYTCSENTFLVYNEITRPSVARMRGFVTNPVIATSTAIYLVASLCAYFTFGSSINGSNLVLSYPAKDVAVDVANLAIVFIETAGSPLKIHPARQALMALVYDALSLGGGDPQEFMSGRFPKVLYVASTATILALVFITAMLVSNLGVVFALIGAVASTGLMFYIPGFAFHKLFASEDVAVREDDTAPADEEEAHAKGSSALGTPAFLFSSRWVRFHRLAGLTLGVLGVAIMLVSLANVFMSIA